MVKSIDLDHFRSEIEAERLWREDELRFLKNRLAYIDATHAREIYRKSLVVMLYAYFEGIVRVILTTYVSAINREKLTVGDASHSLAACALSPVFRALYAKDRKSKVFKGKLPDDEKLHRFARERDFLSELAGFRTRQLTVDAEDIVDTESNLKPVVIRKILYRLGFDPDVVSPWMATINELLGRRNHVSHGSQRSGVSRAEYDALEEAVRRVIDQVVLLVTRGLMAEQYRLP